MSTTHPLPYHPPSTPLPVGEVVYMVICKLDLIRTATTYQVYKSYMKHKDIHDMFIIDTSCEAAAKRKSNGELIKISTHMLGYIEGERRYSEVDIVMQSALLHGYDIRWESKNSNQYHSVFEDEDSIVPLRDLIILDGEQLYNEVTMDGQPKQMKSEG